MRPTVDAYFTRMAQLVATRGTCIRRQVGCVLVNKRNHVVSTGYNGVAAGMPHCAASHRVAGPRPGGYRLEYPNACNNTVTSTASGTNLDDCQAIHAEQNALLQCPDVHSIKTCYTTTMPCVTCLKLLMGTSCERIVYLEDYPHGDAVTRLAEIAGIVLVKYDGES